MPRTGGRETSGGSRARLIHVPQKYRSTRPGLQDTDRQDRVTDAFREDGLRALPSYEGAAQSPVSTPQFREYPHPHDRRAHTGVLQLGASPAATSAASGHPDPLCDIHSTRLQAGIEHDDCADRDAARTHQAESERNHEDRSARDPLRARLWFPEREGPDYGIWSERELADRQPRSVRSADGRISCAGFSRREAAPGDDFFDSAARRRRTGRGHAADCGEPSPTQRVRPTTSRTCDREAPLTLGIAGFRYEDLHRPEG